jgi:hypothetical protein
MEETKLKYTIEDILEMMGGYSYFDYEQIQYIFHHLNGQEEKAQYYLDFCLEKAKKMKEMSDKMKKPEEIENINIDDDNKNINIEDDNKNNI